MKNIFFFFSFCCFMLFSVSCSEEFLDRKPTGSVSTDEALSTTSNIASAINGVYRALMVRYQDSQGHTGHPHMMIILDALGEDYVMGTANSAWHVNEQRWVSHRQDVSVVNEFAYQMYFRAIANLNLVLDRVGKASGIESQKNALAGESLALRAWCYFNLVQLYGKRYQDGGVVNSQLGVSMPLVPTIEGLPRSTVEEVYTQINADLDAAIGLLTTKRTFKSHINLRVAQGIKARVALVQGKWSVAEQFANLARTELTLMTQAQYQEGFADITNPEWMWGFDHQEDQSEFFGGYHSYISCNYNSSNIRAQPKAINRVLYNQMSLTDVRRKMWQ
ncbi:MAG: RagB/SusD family nutrient uptake outer membrane protein, partial [Cyclobacteriaceae bacterium]|nr:RagB/SusD family nutrient uptake outer membrane protein [Cyclobacteriaceae bacterium]